MAVELVRDFAWAGLLMIIGYGLRSKIRLLQKLYIPAAVVAGLVGLLAGPEVLGKLTPFSVGFSEHIGSMAMPLLAIVFSTQFIGTRFDKRVIKHSLSTCFLNSGTACMQVFLGLVLTVACIGFRDGLPLGFGLMPFTGFYGGHGVPAGSATTFDLLGHWEAGEALSVGNTFATFGMLYGIIVGIVIINLAVRKDLIAQNAGMKSLKSQDISGFIPPEERTSAVDMVTKNDAINPVAFQMGIIGGMVFFGYILLDLIHEHIPALNSLTITIPVLFVAIPVAVIGNKTSLGKYLDGKSLRNTAGSALEFLITTSVATTKLSIFISYGLELLLLTVIILTFTTFYVLYFGKRWHREHWVENSLGTFGLATGVLATGFLLIRVADPDGNTTAATNLAIGNSISTTTVQLLLLYGIPHMIVTAPAMAIGAVGAGAVLFTLIGGVTAMRRKGAAVPEFSAGGS